MLMKVCVMSLSACGRNVLQVSVLNSTSAFSGPLA